MSTMISGHIYASRRNAKSLIPDTQPLKNGSSTCSNMVNVGIKRYTSRRPGYVLYAKTVATLLKTPMTCCRTCKNSIAISSPLNNSERFLGKVEHSFPDHSQCALYAATRLRNQYPLKIRAPLKDKEHNPRQQRTRLLESLSRRAIPPQMFR